MIKKQLIYWGMGFIASLLFIWGVSAVFTNSVTPVVWDDSVQRFVSTPMSTTRVRNEGWANSNMGRHGLTRTAEKIFYSPILKVMFWGDSFALGNQVSEEQRVMSVFNAKASNSTTRMVTAADSGLSVADFYFYIPRYEQLTSNIVGHVFLLAGMRSIIPGKQLDCHSRFLPDPWRFKESNCPPSELALRYVSTINQFDLDFLHQIYSAVKNYSFRFSPGNMSIINPKQPVDEPPFDPVRLENAWRFLIASLKEQTDAKLSFVYVPLKPSIENGTIHTQDPDKQEMELFKALCNKLGVQFIDLTQDFADFYEHEGKLAQGFFNTPQGYGHLNKDGQYIVGNGLYKYLIEDK